MATGKFTLDGHILLDDETMTIQVLGVLRPVVDPVASIPANLRTLEVTDAIVALAWSGGTGTEWEVYRDEVLLDTVTTEFYDDETVDPDTSYSYTVRATAPSVSELTDPLVVVTEAAPPVTPDPPTDLAIVQVTRTTATISWTADAGVVEWDVYRDAVLRGTVATPQYGDTGLTPDTAYDYTIVARNGAGDSDPSDVFEVSTLPNAAPVWLSSPNQSGNVGDAINLLLTPLVDDSDEDPITFSLPSGSTVPGLAISADGTRLVGAYSTAGSYTQDVRASDGVDFADTTFSYAVAALPDTTAPSIPQNPAATANGSTVTFTWEASTDAESGVRRYRILRDGIFLKMSTGSPEIMLGVPDGSYIFTVRSEDNAGNISSQSAEAPVDVVTVNPNPDVPTDFEAIPADLLHLDLSWTAGTSGATPDDYDIDFSTVGPDGPWTALPVTGTGTTFGHNTLSAVQHWYRLRANNGAFFSAYATATGTPNGGFGNPNFIIAAGTSEFDCANATPVTGAARKVLPGEIVQINSKDGNLSGTILEIKNPEGTASNPIRFRPPPTARCNFKRNNPGGGFVVQISGSMADPDKHRGVMFDGETTASAITPDPDTGLRYGFRFQPANGSDNPTGWLDVHGFVRNVTVRYVHFDVAGHGGSAWAPNTNTLTRDEFPGVFKGPFTFEWCRVDGSGGVYIGSNYSKKFPSPGGNPMGLPSKDVTVAHSYWTGTMQTPILIKNCWEGNCELHHNVIKSCSIDGTVANPVVQKRSIAANGCAGSIHHNWIEDTALNTSGGAQSPNHAIVCGTNKGPSDTGDPGYNLNGAGVPQPYPFMLMRVYSNIVFKGPEMGFNSADDPNTSKMRIELFSNTFDNFRDYGISISDTNHDQSFARNNVVTRCRPSGTQVRIKAADVSRNFLSGSRGDADGTLSGIYTAVGAKSYQLVAARAVHGTSLLFNGSNNGDVAPTDYDGVTRSSVAGADMGAYERS